MAALRLHKPFYEVFQQKLFESAVWIQGTFMHPFQETHTLFKKSYTFMHLKEEYARLAHENEILKWQLQILEPLAHENAMLKQNLDVFPAEQYLHLTARVLSSPYDGLHHFFLIAAGIKQGLEKNQAVITPEGILGRLEKVGNTVARVLLLNDVNSRIPVMTTHSNQKAILAGDGSFSPTLVYVRDILKIRKGEKIITSGFGGIFPPGLPVGVVDEIANGKIHVKPCVSFHTLEWVRVLKPYSEGILQEVESALEGE